MQRPANVSWITWQVWGLSDLRNEILDDLVVAGLPALFAVPVGKIPFMIGCAEYALKTGILEDPGFVLRQAEREAQSWRG